MGIVCVLYTHVLFPLIIKLQMVMFVSKLKETGAKIVVITTSQYTPSCVFLEAQY